MEQLLYLREEHGDSFATQLPNGQIIPWRPLSMGEYLKYEEMYRAGVYPPAFIEDEIFRLCVKDGAFVKNIDKQLAGTVSAVVATIMAYSGPSSLDELNQFLNMNRVKASGMLHELVNFVLLAFPSYKPEDLYDMEYSTLMLRVAQAERKLLSQGFINEPLSFEKPGEEQGPTEEEVAARKKANSEMIDRYYEQEGIQVPDSVKQARADLREKIIDHPKPPPVPKETMEQTVITRSDMMEHEAVLTGHEQDIVHKVKATDETAHIYADYLEQLKDGGKIRMKSDEERKAEAEARMAANKQKVIERRKEAMEAAKKELPELLKVREEARKRKQRKAARRKKK